MDKIKTIVLHDYLMHKGGGERLILTLARALGAPLITGFNEKTAFNPGEFGVISHTLGEPVSYPGFRYLAVQNRFRRYTDVYNYDAVIFSGNCIAAARNCASHAARIFYCHTPIRNAYDLYEYYLMRMPWWKKIAYRLFCTLIRFNYQRDLKHIDIIVANSKHIQQRIKKYLNRDSIVINPPIDTKKFTWISQGDYYLSFARIDLVKRVTDIAEAFTHMPNKKLIIASTGTEVERVKTIIKDAPNIIYVGPVDDTKLRELVGSCIATIYIPKDEDFGMSPLESMAAGKPCLGVAEGGLIETISHQKDGILLRANPSIDHIIEGVTYLTPTQCLSMKDACIAKAHMFREEVFIEKMNNIISETIENKK